MTMDWCLGIREACAHWREAPMLQQTFEALEQTLAEDNDASIDCAKASRLLYQLDRDAYVEALNAARGAPVPVVESVEELGDA